MATTSATVLNHGRPSSGAAVAQQPHPLSFTNANGHASISLQEPEPDNGYTETAMGTVTQDVSILLPEELSGPEVTEV